MNHSDIETILKESIMNSGLTAAELEPALRLLGVMFIVVIAFFCIIFVRWVLSLIARWWVFRKAGEAGWKGIVPVYSRYVQYRLTWNTKMFWIALALIIVGEFMDGEGVLGLVAALLALAGYFINNVLAAHKLSKAFGHGVPFTVGLFFFEGIFMLILAFGKSVYLGNTTVAAPAAEVAAEPAMPADGESSAE